MSNTVADKLARKTRRKTPTKQVRLKLVYVDFWSAVKFSFMVSLCLAVVQVVCTILVYLVLLQTGVLAKVNEVFTDVVGGDMSLMSFLGLPQVLTFTLIVAVLGTIIGTAIGAVAALVYNLIVRVLGGFQLGFSSN